MPREWLVRAQRRLSGVIPFFCLPLYRRQTLKEVIPEFYPIGRSDLPADSSFSSDGIGPLPFVAPCYAFSICRADRVRATETCLLTVQSLNSQKVVSSDLVKIQRRGSGDVLNTSSINVGSRGEGSTGDSWSRNLTGSDVPAKTCEGKGQNRTPKSSTMKGGKLLARKSIER